MQPGLSLLIVFAAGLLSFLSPFVLLLIPGYIAFVTGISVADLTEKVLDQPEIAGDYQSLIIHAIADRMSPRQRE